MGDRIFPSSIWRESNRNESGIERTIPSPCCWYFFPGYRTWSRNTISSGVSVLSYVGIQYPVGKYGVGRCFDVLQSNMKRSEDDLVQSSLVYDDAMDAIKEIDSVGVKCGWLVCLISSFGCYEQPKGNTYTTKASHFLPTLSNQRPFPWLTTLSSSFHQSLVSAQSTVVECCSTGIRSSLQIIGLYPAN